MTKKIFQSILLVAGCVLLASLLIIVGFLYDYFGGVEKNQLRDELSLAAAAVEDGGTDYLSQLTADRCRLTWIAADGSVLYDVAFRNQTEDQIRTLAAEACMSFNSVHMEGFDELSQTQIQAFDSFVRYAQSQGTTVILVLSPWHPYLYGYLLTEPENHKGFFQVENWLRQYCADNNVPIYGSYDPACIEGLQETDFFDGLHCGGTGIARFFPGIPQALSDLQNGTLANPLDVHPRTSLEDSNAQPAEGETPDGEVTQQEG